MSNVRLDHATINTLDLEASITFYEQFLGMKAGWRPDFAVDGAWLYPQGGDYPIVHLIVRERPTDGGKFDHVAFRSHDLSAYLDKVKASGSWYSAMPVPETTLVQVQHYDPNGVLIEVNFDGEEIDLNEIRTNPAGVVRQS